MDDIPLRLFNERDAAFRFAESADWQPPIQAARILGLPDCSTPINIAVWAYRDGEPVSRVIVRDWEDEGDDDESPVEDPSPVVPEVV